MKILSLQRCWSGMSTKFYLYSHLFRKHRWEKVVVNETLVRMNRPGIRCDKKLVQIRESPRQQLLSKKQKKRSRVMVLRQCSASVARLALQLLTTIKSGCHPSIRAAKKRLHATHMQVWRTDFDSTVFRFFASTHAKLYSLCQILDSRFEENRFLL